MKAATKWLRETVVLTGISIHAAREGGDPVLREARDEINISIHAAREGGDQVVRCKDCPYFISIHAAREGGDYAQASGSARLCDFNPRRP